MRQDSSSSIVGFLVKSCQIAGQIRKILQATVRSSRLILTELAEHLPTMPLRYFRSAMLHRVRKVPPNDAGADPPEFRGRPQAVREASDRPTGQFPPGWWRRHAWKMEAVATREALTMTRTRQPEPRERQPGPSGWGGQA